MDQQSRYRSRSQNEDLRAIEKYRDSQAQQRNRSQPNIRELKRDRDRNDKRSMRNNIEYLIEQYELGVQEGATRICVCCGGLFFKRTVKTFNPQQHNSKSNFPAIYNYREMSEDNKHWICHTCFKYLMTSKIPKIALSNKLEFNVIAPCIEQLNDVEERMCSPRIAFIRIRPLAWDAQKGNKTTF